jgi:hypothetical protein
MKKIRFLSIGLLWVLLITACGQNSTATPTTNPEAVLTSVAQTAAARLVAMSSVTSIPTSTFTPTSTPTLLPSSTPFPSTITGTVPIPMSTAATVTTVAVS